MSKEQESFSIKKRLKSFTYAFEGIKTLFRDEHNARIHIVAAILAIAASVFFKISVTEWCLIVLCIVLVISAEAMNSAVENITDLASPQIHPLARKAKDMAAAAVLILAVGAVIVGCIIFLPKFLNLIN
jgi:diacylglycerol kinase